MLYGPQNSAINGGLLVSQSSIFNSKHNISGLGSVDMSFGKATEDGNLSQGLHYGTNGACGGPNNTYASINHLLNKNTLANLNRQYKSDRNVFKQNQFKETQRANAEAAKNGNGAGIGPIAPQKRHTTEQFADCEVVNMGELLKTSQEKKLWLQAKASGTAHEDE